MYVTPVNLMDLEGVEKVVRWGPRAGLRMPRRLRGPRADPGLTLEIID